MIKFHTTLIIIEYKLDPAKKGYFEKKFPNIEESMSVIHLIVIQTILLVKEMETA